MQNLKINKSVFPKEEDLVHFKGIISSICVLPDNSVQIRILMKYPFTNHPLFEVNRSIIDCILPPISANQLTPYKNLLHFLGNSVPCYTDDTIDLFDLQLATVIASVKPKYVRKNRFYATKLINLIIVSLN